MLSSPPSMPTSAMHAVVAKRRRGDGDRCRLPPAPQRAQCCRHRRRPAVGHRAQARCCRRRRRSLAKPSEDTVLVRPTRTGSPPRSRRRRRPLSAPPRASTSAMLSSPPSTVPQAAAHGPQRGGGTTGTATAASIATATRGGGTAGTATAASIATATAVALPPPQRARCCRRPMLSLPPSMPTRQRRRRARIG